MSRFASRSGVSKLAAFRGYASVGSQTLIAKPPAPPPPISNLDTRILTSAYLKSQPLVDMHALFGQYTDRAGRVLHRCLPYESRPGSERRISFSEAGDIALIAHWIQQGDDHKIALSSGFRLNVQETKGESIFITCAHTLEEIQRCPLFIRSSSAVDSKHAGVSSGTCVITGSEQSLQFYPVVGVASALHRSDLLLLSTQGPKLRPLPLSPYPAPAQTAIRAHFVSHQFPDEPGWSPWVGGTWSKWIQGQIMGYRDFAGREAQPGTYDALSHLLFDPPPTAGSSGGPIVDEESGAVVGIMLGTWMDSRVEGLRGWGVPSETVFEMFNLPGLEGKN